MSEMYRQPPILTGHDGGRSLSDEQVEREWREAWALIAEACEQGLTGLHPLHPRREDLLRLTRTARRTAGVPDRPGLRTA
jgi:hypothetical protein